MRTLWRLTLLRLNTFPLFLCLNSFCVCFLLLLLQPHIDWRRGTIFSWLVNCHSCSSAHPSLVSSGVTPSSSPDLVGVPDDYQDLAGQEQPSGTKSWWKRCEGWLGHCVSPAGSCLNAEPGKPSLLETRSRFVPPTSPSSHHSGIAEKHLRGLSDPTCSP